MIKVILICLFLGIINAQDYCKIEPLTCARHIFDVSALAIGDTFTCTIQPLQYNGTTGAFHSIGSQESVAPVSVSETQVECRLSVIQAAEVKLEGAQAGVLAETGFIYPETCFTCSSMSQCTRKTDMWIWEKGCYIDNVCYPTAILNPANPTQTCYAGYNVDGWIDYPFQYVLSYPIAISVCSFNDSLNYIGMQFTKDIKRAIAPGGVEALDMTHQGTLFRIPAFSFDSLSYSYSLKFYVKFDRKPIKDTITFMDVPMAMTLKRRQDAAIIIDYTFLDAAANQIRKTAVLQKAGDKTKSGKLQGDNSIQTNKWLLIGLGYHMRSGVAQLNWFLDGEEVFADLGDLTGLYLRTAPAFDLKNAAFSCFEVSDTMKGAGYFGVTSLQECEKFFEGKSKTYYDNCEAAYMPNGVLTKTSL